MEELQEKALQHKAAATPAADGKTPYMELDGEVRLALKYADEKKAENMVALDLREIASFAEFFIIASGTNQRQVQAIADEITEQLKKQADSRPVRVEGYSTGEWVLLDYGDFIVHIFDKDSREFYDLERLWRDAKRVEIPDAF